MQIPTKGRVVLFHEKVEGLTGLLTHTAFITDAGPVGTPNDGMVTLAVFPADGVEVEAVVLDDLGRRVGTVKQHHASKVVERVSAGGPNADQPTAGCWTWPPRV